MKVPQSLSTELCKDAQGSGAEVREVQGLAQDHTGEAPGPQARNLENPTREVSQLCVTVVGGDRLLPSAVPGPQLDSDDVGSVPSPTPSSTSTAGDTQRQGTNPSAT